MLWEKIRWFCRIGLKQRNRGIRRGCFVLMAVILFWLTGCAQVYQDTSGETDIECELPEDNIWEDGDTEEGSDETKQWEKGYDLPVSEEDKKEAETDCRNIMEIISDLYIKADKGNSVNVVIPDRTLRQMAQRLKEKGYTVVAAETYDNMKNYKNFEEFLNLSKSGKNGSAVIYEIHSDGGVGRKKYVFDGTDLYILSGNAGWDSEGHPIITGISCARAKEWKFTDKGWFICQMCVPEPPEVSEMVDGGVMFRVKPLSRAKRRASEKYVSGLGYQGNNLLCSNWDTEHMGRLDYNGLYEYLYEMKYQKKFNVTDHPEGIPKTDFERLIMEYLPVTAEEIRKQAVFDEEKQTYAWVRLGCFNYELHSFRTSVPEVTQIRKNKDGTMTLTVDAVCEMILCDDAVITHELTIRTLENGGFQYLGNHILGDGMKSIPKYQYRVKDTEG